MVTGRSGHHATSGRFHRAAHLVAAFRRSVDTLDSGLSMHKLHHVKEYPVKPAARPRRSPRPRHLVLASVPALALMLTGCEMHEQTQGWYPRYDGVSAEAGEIGLRNIVVVTSGDQATVLTSLANEGPADDLVSVRVGDVTAEPTSGSLAIPQNGYAALGPDSVQFEGVDLTPGQLTEVEFRFEDAPSTTVETLVKEAEGRYADVTFSDPQQSPGADQDAESAAADEG